MISGNDAFARIESAMRGIRADEDRLTQVMSSISEQAARVRAGQVEDYKQLARIKLDALQARPITVSLDDAERRALHEAMLRQTAGRGIAVVAQAAAETRWCRGRR